MSDEAFRHPPLKIGIKLPNLMFLTRPLREFVSTTLEATGFDEEEIDEIALITTEVVNNSFEHASDEEWHEVEIDMVVQEDMWVLRIRDIGEGRLRQEDFDFEGKGPPEHLEDRGRGTYLISCFSDQVVVREVPTGGTEVEITKYRKVQA